MPAEPGQTLLHYRIVDKIGEGEALAERLARGPIPVDEAAELMASTLSVLCIVKVSPPNNATNAECASVSGS